MKPHLHYGDIIYDQPDNNNLNQKIERIQCNPALATAVTMEVTSQSKLGNN